MHFAALENGRVVYTSEADELPADALYEYVPYTGDLPVRPAPYYTQMYATETGFAWVDPRSLVQCRADRWAELKAHRLELDVAPIEVAEGIMIDADMQARSDIMGAIMTMQLTGTTTREWRCVDNVMRWLTLAQIISAGVAVATRRSTLIKTSDTVFQALEAASTLEEVYAVTWPILED